MSAGIVSGNHVFLAGVTGSGPDGHMPNRAAAQFEAIFDKLAATSAEARLDLNEIVEMTRYHVGCAITSICSMRNARAV